MDMADEARKAKFAAALERFLDENTELVSRLADFTPPPVPEVPPRPIVDSLEYDYRSGDGVTTHWWQLKALGLNLHWNYRAEDRFIAARGVLRDVLDLWPRAVPSSGKCVYCSTNNGQPVCDACFTYGESKVTIEEIHKQHERTQAEAIAAAVEAERVALRAELRRLIDTSHESQASQVWKNAVGNALYDVAEWLKARSSSAAKVEDGEAYSHRVDARVHLETATLKERAAETRIADLEAQVASLRADEKANAALHDVSTQIIRDVISTLSGKPWSSGRHDNALDLARAAAARVAEYEEVADALGYVNHHEGASEVAGVDVLVREVKELRKAQDRVTDLEAQLAEEQAQHASTRFDAAMLRDVVDAAVAWWELDLDDEPAALKRIDAALRAYQQHEKTSATSAAEGEAHGNQGEVSGVEREQGREEWAGERDARSGVREGRLGERVVVEGNAKRSSHDDDQQPGRARVLGGGKAVHPRVHGSASGGVANEPAGRPGDASAVTSAESSARCFAERPGTETRLPLVCSLPLGHEGDHDEEFGGRSHSWPREPRS